MPEPSTPLKFDPWSSFDNSVPRREIHASRVNLAATTWCAVGMIGLSIWLTLRAILSGSSFGPGLFVLMVPVGIAFLLFKFPSVELERIDSTGLLPGDWVVDHKSTNKLFSWSSWPESMVVPQDLRLVQVRVSYVGLLQDGRTEIGLGFSDGTKHIDYGNQHLLRAAPSDPLRFFRHKRIDTEIPYNWDLSIELLEVLEEAEASRTGVTIEEIHSSVDADQTCMSKAIDEGEAFGFLERTRPAKTRNRLLRRWTHIPDRIKITESGKVLITAVRLDISEQEYEEEFQTVNNNQTYIQATTLHGDSSIGEINQATETYVTESTSDEDLAEFIEQLAFAIKRNPREEPSEAQELQAAAEILLDYTQNQGSDTKAKTAIGTIAVHGKDVALGVLGEAAWYVLAKWAGLN